MYILELKTVVTTLYPAAVTVSSMATVTTVVAIPNTLYSFKIVSVLVVILYSSPYAPNMS